MNKQAYEVDGLSPRRQAFDQAIIRGIEAFLRFFAAHWLALLNVVNFGFGGGAVLSPFLMSIGATDLGSLFFRGYGFVCHQLPYRSDLLLGFQVAMCQRNMAIYASMFISGVAFAFMREQLKPLPWRWYIVLIAPMAMDGLTQLFGLRESNWTLRVITGSLFGLATVWLAYPHLEIAMRQLVGEMAGAREKRYDEGSQIGGSSA